MTETIVGPDGKLRCRWSDAAPEFLTYHDTEWGFPVDDDPQTVSTSAESVALSKELKKLGWKFVGPTTVYAFMQAMGLINDHVEGCVIQAKVECARRDFKRPGH